MVKSKYGGTYVRSLNALFGDRSRKATTEE